MKLADSPHTVNLLDCGYVSAPNEAPISGEIESFGRDVIGFSRALEEFCERGWRPYLALENLPRNENLFYQMRPDKAGSAPAPAHRRRLGAGAAIRRDAQAGARASASPTSITSWNTSTGMASTCA